MAAGGPILQTPRLILRPPRVEDLEGYVALMSDAEHVRFIGGAAPRGTVWRQMMTVAGSWSLHGFGFFSVFERASGRWIGRLGPWRPEGWPGDEVGWSLLREAGGQGYATEGAAAAMDWAFDRLGWTEVIHCIAPENLPSARVAERLGSTRRGPTRLPPPMEDLDIEVWGQTRDEWRENRRRFDWLDSVVAGDA